MSPLEMEMLPRASMGNDGCELSDFQRDEDWFQQRRIAEDGGAGSDSARPEGCAFSENSGREAGSAGNELTSSVAWAMDNTIATAARCARNSVVGPWVA